LHSALPLFKTEEESRTYFSRKRLDLRLRVAPATEVSMSTETREKKPVQFRVGQLDNSGVTVDRIYVQRADYVVYRTTGAIYIEYDHELEGIDTYYDLNAKILRYTSKVTSILPTDLNTCEGLSKQVARAVATNLRGETAIAIEMLEEADVRIRRFKLLQGRMHYTISSLVTTVVVLLIGYLHYLILPEDRRVVTYWDIVSCGAMGGFLSVVMGFRRLAIDVDANFLTHCLVGSSRILIAMVAAVSRTS